jgi:uncharacterized protein
VRIVLDTNVIVSATMTTRGPSAQIVNLFVDGEFDLYVDDRLLDEYEAVLHRPELPILPDDAAVVLELIRAIAKPVAATPLAVSLPDAKDLAFLEVAVTAGAILVTGNLRHFPKKSCQNVTVVSPREFLELLRQFGI